MENGNGANWHPIGFKIERYAIIFNWAIRDYTKYLNKI